VKAVGLLLGALILWISKALPMSITTLLLIFLLPLMGLMEYQAVLSNFGIGTALFIMASSGIAVAIINSTIPYKITEKIFAGKGKHPIVLIFCFGLAVTVFSGFVSSLATCTLFTTLAAAALQNMKLSKEKSNFAKVVMLSIPVCSGIGGFISPAGTPANLLVLEWMNNNGLNMTFAKWCAIGFPVCILSAVVFLTFAVLLYKPEKLNFEGSFEVKRLSRHDCFVLTVVCLVMLGWFLSSFVPAINITLVAIVGLVLLMLPSFEVLTFRDFSEGVNWDLVSTMGSVSVLMTAIADTGIVTKVATAVMNILPVSNLFILLFGLSIVICAIRAFVPTTTAVIALLLPMLVDISALSNLNCGVLLLIAAFWAATALLLIFTEPIFLISYKEGYFKQKDLLKVGVPTNVVLAASCPLLIYAIFSCW
jgi:sodium-dependent dicarboxylate transporter 2/3/5